MIFTEYDELETMDIIKKDSWDNGFAEATIRDIKTAYEEFGVSSDKLIAKYGKDLVKKALHIE